MSIPLQENKCETFIGHNEHIIKKIQINVKHFQTMGRNTGT